jgi:hypothetical protein
MTTTVRLPAPDLPAGPRSALVIDALEFAAVLADPTIGGFQVTSIVDRPAHEVRIAIDEFLDSRTPEDLVVVYFSCHA